MPDGASTCRRIPGWAFRQLGSAKQADRRMNAPIRLGVAGGEGSIDRQDGAMIGASGVGSG